MQGSVIGDFVPEPAVPPFSSRSSAVVIDFSDQYINDGTAGTGNHDCAHGPDKLNASARYQRASRHFVQQLTFHGGYGYDRYQQQ